MVVIKNIEAEATLKIRKKVLWPQESLAYVALEDDDQGLHYGLFLEDKLISVISVFVKDTKAQFRKFATLQAYQSMGYGSLLFDHMLKAVKAMAVCEIWCNARRDAESFYRRFDFEVLEGSDFVKKNVTYRLMALKL